MPESGLPVEEEVLPMPVIDRPDEGRKRLEIALVEPSGDGIGEKTSGKRKKKKKSRPSFHCWQLFLVLILLSRFNLS